MYRWKLEAWQHQSNLLRLRARRRLVWRLVKKLPVSRIILLAIQLSLAVSIIISAFFFSPPLASIGKWVTSLPWKEIAFGLLGLAVLYLLWKAYKRFLKGKDIKIRWKPVLWIAGVATATAIVWFVVWPRIVENKLNKQIAKDNALKNAAKALRTAIYAPPAGYTCATGDEEPIYRNFTIRVDTSWSEAVIPPCGHTVRAEGLNKGVILQADIRESAIDPNPKVYNLIPGEGKIHVPVIRWMRLRAVDGSAKVRITIFPTNPRRVIRDSVVTGKRPHSFPRQPQVMTASQVASG